jgi:hypothetical protein
MKKISGVLLFACVSALGGCANYTPDYSDKYIVFFDAQSTKLPTEGKMIIHDAAKAITAMRPVHVAIAGQPSEAAPKSGFNPSLSDPRFDAITTALIAEGINPQLLVRTSLTDAEAKVGPSGKRRVEIRLLKS